MKFKLLAITALTLAFLACSTPKDIAYLQNVTAMQQSQAVAHESTVQVNDRLLITVSATAMLDQTQVAQFNLPATAVMDPNSASLTQSPTLQTYIVDTEGCISFPVIGKVKVAGLQHSEAVRLLSDKISPYLSDPIINLQILSFNVSVLGEVLKQGLIPVENEKITVFEALAAAGDMTIYGDRRHVKLIRNNIDGVPEIHELDLTQASIIQSPYYYLQQNDVLYVEPNKTKKRDSRYGSSDSFTISILSIGFTAISMVVTVLGFFKK